MGELTIRFAASWRERQELIDLRTLVYSQAGKHASSGRMTDKWDARAIQVGVYRDGVPIASARVIDSDPTDEWEHDRFVSWQRCWPDRADCLEISRFCVLRQERRWRVIAALSEGLGHAVLRTRKRFVLACCTADLKPFYETFFGVRFTGQVIIHDDLGTAPHHMFVNDVHARIRGEGLRWLPWLGFWPGVARQAAADARIQSESIGASHVLPCRAIVGRIAQPAVTWLLERRKLTRRRAPMGATGPGASATEADGR